MRLLTLQKATYAIGILFVVFLLWNLNKTYTSNTPFNIHIIACKRYNSTKRLLTELNTYICPRYRNSLYIRIDDCGVDFDVDNYKWKCGTTHVIKETQHRGLRNMWIDVFREEYTKSDNTAQFLVLEDDITLSQFYYKNINAHRDFSVNYPPCVIGYSLSPIKYCEMQKPFFKWTPPILYSEYYSSTPSSWAPVFTHRFLKGFLMYYDERIKYNNETEEYRSHTVKSYDELRLQPKEIEIPDSRTNVWPFSWKKFLFEYMYGNGYVMAYPHLYEDSGFATSMFLHGEHTYGSNNPRGAVLVNYYSVVTAFVEDIIHTKKHMLPVFDSFCNKSELSTLAIKGYKFVSTIPHKKLKAVWNLQTNGTCLLDHIGIPIKSSTLSTKLLKFLMYNGINNQLESFEHAITISNFLERRLTYHNLSSPEVCSSCYTRIIDRYINVNVVDDSQIKPRALIVNEPNPIYGSTSNIDDILTVNVGMLSKSMLSYWFKSCSDDVLFFNGMFKQILSKPPLLTYTEIVNQTSKIVMDRLKMSSEYTCAHYRNGDFQYACDFWNKTKWYMNNIKNGFACKQDIHTLQEYLLLSPVDIVLLSPEPIDFVRNIGRVTVVTSNDICNIVKTYVGDDDIMCAVVEQNICTKASSTMLNRFSTFSRRIARLRNYSETKYWVA